MSTRQPTAGAPADALRGEFARLRDYVPGDDPRHIAWKSAACRGRLIVQEFRVERGQDVVICLDCSERGGMAQAGGSWLDGAVDAALRLAALALRCEDRVGAWCFAHEVLAGAGQDRGVGHLQALTRRLGAAAVLPHHADYRRLSAHLMHRLAGRSLVVILTHPPGPDRHQELAAAVAHLVPRHLPLICWTADRDLAARAAGAVANLDDLPAAVAAGQMADQIATAAADLRAQGALVIEDVGGDLAVAAANAYLDVKRRQAL